LPPFKTIFITIFKISALRILLIISLIYSESFASAQGASLFKMSVTSLNNFVIA